MRFVTDRLPVVSAAGLGPQEKADWHGHSCVDGGSWLDGLVGEISECASGFFCAYKRLRPGSSAELLTRGARPSPCWILLALDVMMIGLTPVLSAPSIALHQYPPAPSSVHVILHTYGLVEGRLVGWALRFG